MCTLPKPSATFFLTVSSLVIVRMHLASCLSVLKQVGKHDMIRCLLWLRCCNKIISSCSRQTMEALTNMWIHATNKGSPLAVMMVRFYIFKHFMNSVFVDCRGFWIAGILKVSLSPHSYNVGIEGLECPKIKNINFDLTGSCTATATNPSTGECNESICPSGYCNLSLQLLIYYYNY